MKIGNVRWLPESIGRPIVPPNNLELTWRLSKLFKLASVRHRKCQAWLRSISEGPIGHRRLTWARIPVIF